MGSRLVLASASPRRREILATAGFEFEVMPADVDERPLAGEIPAAYVERLAWEKAKSVWREGTVTLGADTVVTIGDHLLEKPLDGLDAARMLRLLSGRVHEVMTGFCVFDGVRAHRGVETTRVRFVELGEREIEEYVASGEPLDKAGGYAIQGLASKFVDRVEGCYFNVVGLPIARIYSFIRSSLR